MTTRFSIRTPITRRLGSVKKREYSKGAMHQIAIQSGVKRADSKLYDSAHELMRIYIKDILDKAVSLIELRRAVTITKNDINEVLRIVGEKVYGL